MYLGHNQLEDLMKELDTERKGLITVEQLDGLLQDRANFNLPPEALDQVFTEMLGQPIQNVDRACIIKIDQFMECLRGQFDQMQQQWVTMTEHTYQ